MTTTATSSLLFTVARPKCTEFYNKTNITLSKSSIFLKETISLARSLSLDKLQTIAAIEPVDHTIWLS
jgi:hypothetical protein